MKVAVINCGSSSIKYEVFDAGQCTMLATGLIERIGSADGRLRQRKRKADGSFEELSFTRPLKDHREGFAFMAEANRKERIIGDESELFGIGHRVVHGGDVFREPAVIDDEVVTTIKKLIPLAPLHNPSNLLGIEVSRERFPGVRQVAVFDTAFHQTLPPYAYHYAVPYDLYEEHHVRRYGFHGTSHAFVSKEAANRLGKPLSEVNLITLHLGNGASAAAVKGGLSVDTSMGMTPLEGLVMGTRCGDIDPSLPFYLMRQTGMPPERLENLLNRESGLRGICGVSDMREIQDLSVKGNERGELAIGMFCYRIKKYIGAYFAVLGRLDGIVFTGGIGENSAVVRQNCCEGLQHLGIAVDHDKNAAASGAIAEIQKGGLPVKVLVIKTNEELEIARQTIAAVERAKKREKG
jgi:acetate kinase